MCSGSESRAVIQSHQPQKRHCSLSNSRFFSQKWVMGRGKKFTLIPVWSPQQLQAIISLFTKCYASFKKKFLKKGKKRKLIRHKGVIQALWESSASSSINPLIAKYSQIWHGSSWAESWDGTGWKPIILWDSACKTKCGQTQCNQGNI